MISAKGGRRKNASFCRSYYYINFVVNGIIGSTEKCKIMSSLFKRETSDLSSSSKNSDVRKFGVSGWSTERILLGRCGWLCVRTLVDTYSLSCLPLAGRLAINLPRSRSCLADLPGGSRQHERDLRSRGENYEARSLLGEREKERKCTCVETTGPLVNLRSITPLSRRAYANVRVYRKFVTTGITRYARASSVRARTRGKFDQMARLIESPSGDN